MSMVLYRQGNIMKTCKFDNCQNKHDSHGFCANHARQYKKYGHPLSKDEVHQRLSQAKVGSTHKGAVWTDEMRKARSLAMKGRQLNTGRTHFKKGQESWNSGTHGLMTAWNKGLVGVMPEAWNKGKKVPQMTNENNPMWKGDEVSYRSLHKWVERHLGRPDTCENCKTSGLTARKIHWSNISGKYLRDVTDWQRLCASCHGAYDSGKLTLAEIRG